MKSQWVKQGLLYSLPENGLHPKLRSHTANPTPVHLHEDTYRIFYSARDASNRSSVGAVDIDLATKQIVKAHKQPFLEYGPPGSFFQDGISLGNYYEASGRRYLTFMGWQNPPDGHWRGDIGRLILKDDLSLEVESLNPFMRSDESDPVSLSYPWIMMTGPEHYDMWYGSTLTWDAGNGEMVHLIKHAESSDGETFKKSPLQVPHEVGVAQAFSRPTLLKLGPNDWHMWFSYRGGNGISYRIGHATSSDGRTWELSLNRQSLDVSAEGWDSNMVEYPYVFTHKRYIIMLYNGDGYGRSGFGMATLTL
jgi:hypothetical protein